MLDDQLVGRAIDPGLAGGDPLVRRVLVDERLFSGPGALGLLAARNGAAGASTLEEGESAMTAPRSTTAAAAASACVELAMFARGRDGSGGQAAPEAGHIVLACNGEGFFFFFFFFLGSR